MNALCFIHDTEFSDLHSDIIHEALRCFVDTMGVAVGGSRTDLSHIIRNHAARQFGGTEAVLWFDGRTTSAAGAALANGMTIDSLDAHDGHKLTKGHVGCGVLSSAIALMQAQKIYDANELLTSIVIGYEIGTRAGIALHASASDYHTSGAWIALASAALGARYLGLNTAQTREALGIAEFHGPRSQMMRCIDAPTMVKDGSGWGAMCGVSASYLAQDGFTGAPAITMEDPALAGYWDDIGTNWYVAQQYVKLYPVCRWAQPAVEGALALARQHRVRADQIAAVRVDSFHEAKRLNCIPTTTEQAQYSLPFSVAAALLHGTIGVDEVTGKGIQDGRVIDLAKRIFITEDDAFNAAFPARRFARVTLELHAGQTLTSAVTEALGDPENKLADAILWDKFRGLTKNIMGADWTETFLTTSLTLPESGTLRPLLDQIALPA